MAADDASLRITKTSNSSYELPFIIIVINNVARMTIETGLLVHDREVINSSTEEQNSPLRGCVGGEGNVVPAFNDGS